MSNEEKRLAAIREVLSAIPSGSRLPVSAILELLGPDHSAEEWRSERALTGAEQITHGTGEVTVREAAEWLEVTPQAVLAAMNRGDLVGRRVGPICVLQAESVKAFGKRRAARKSAVKVPVASARHASRR